MSGTIAARHTGFQFDEFNKVASFRCSDCEFFILHPNEHIPTYGVCDLFQSENVTAAPEKACSKFLRRRDYSA